MQQENWASIATATRSQMRLKKGLWPSKFLLGLCCGLPVTSGRSVLTGEFCLSLQVPQDEWSGYTPRGKDDEIPCRRMRSGSYIKAMGDDDSGDSDTSPKPSPKIAARRESYLKATQPSLTELTTLK